MRDFNYPGGLMNWSSAAARHASTVAILILVSHAALSNAQSIGVNFGGDVASLAPNETAGVIRQDHFNNIVGTPALVMGLVADPDGAASTTAVQQTNVSLTITQAFVESLNNQPTTSDARLMDGMLGLRNGIVAVTSTNPPFGIGFSGLSSFTAGPYDVYVYCDSPANYTNAASRVSQLTLTTTGGSETVPFEDFGNFPGNGTGADYVQTGGAPAAPGNYVIFHDVTGDAFSVFAIGPRTVGGADYGAVNAIQIVAVPEAGFGSLLVIAALGLMRRKRNWKT